jgi:hypothetical protein
MVLDTSTCLAMIKTSVLKTVVLPIPQIFCSIDERAPDLFFGGKTTVFLNYGIALPGIRKLWF